MVTELEITFCQSKADLATGSYIMKIRQCDPEEKNKRTPH